MTAVLGIDAAWTPHHPSGVAVIDRQFWPLAEREAGLRREWTRILRALRSELDDLDLPLPPRGAPGKHRKAFEDTLDAVVCAWVAARYLEKEARAFGDATAAIWIPRG